jgi:hypothetical protein
VKKILLAITICLLLASPSWAVVAYQTSSGQVKASLGVVKGVIVSYTGAVAGDKAELFNSTNGSGTTYVTVIASATAGTVTPVIPQGGILFDSGIYCTVTKTSGTVKVQTIYE